MIKYWQSMQNYKYFLTESKSHFDSSERNRLHKELWKPWQKLRLFDTDKAMEFLLPFYSNTGRPAKNQPQILRSFILFFLLFSEGLAKPSLSLWVDRLGHDRLLAALIGCTTDSLPPLGSYFDFMDRLWTAPPTDLLRGTNCFRLPGTAKSRISPKAKNRKHRRQSPKSQKLSKNDSWPGRISLLTLRAAAALLLSCGRPAFHGIRSHTRGTPYGFRRRHRRAYPCLPTRAPQGWCAGRPAAFLRPRCFLGLGQRPGKILLRLHFVPIILL